MKDRIKQLEETLAKATKDLEALKQPEFKEDDWLYCEGTQYGNYIYNKKYDLCFYYNITYTLVKRPIAKEVYQITGKEGTERLATEEEVKEALVAEAIRRGLVKGATVCNKNLGYCYKGPLNKEEYSYFYSFDKLRLDGVQIYAKGKFAKVINEPGFKEDDWLYCEGYKHGNYVYNKAYNLRFYYCDNQDSVVTDRVLSNHEAKQVYKLAGKEGTERLATDEEIMKVLVGEAKRRGFVEGAAVSNKNLGYRYKAELTNSNDFEYIPDKDILALDHVYIYQKGKFAEVINEPLTIGGYEVEVVDSNCIKIGCRRFSIQGVKEFINIAKIALYNDIEINRENIEILKKALEK